jgi:hypothetical protein
MRAFLNSGVSRIAAPFDGSPLGCSLEATTTAFLFVFLVFLVIAFGASLWWADGVKRKLRVVKTNCRPAKIAAPPAIANSSPLQIYFKKTFTFKRFRVIHGHGRAERGQRRIKMQTFSIDADNNISVFASPEEASAASTTPFDSFSSRQDLADLIAAWPPERLVATFNSLPGVTPVKRFKTSNVAATRIWARIQDLGEAAQPEPEATKSETAPAKPKAGRKAKAGAQSAKGAPSKGRATRKTTPAKKTPKAKTAAKKSKPAKEPKAARTGSKSEEVIALLKRKGGATMAEIVALTGWQKHTTRGWVSGFLGKKMGIEVESFKSDKGERTYRINQ